LLLNKLFSNLYVPSLFLPLPVFLFMGRFLVLLRVAVALFCPGEKEDREQILIVIHSRFAVVSAELGA